MQHQQRSAMQHQQRSTMQHNRLDDHTIDQVIEILKNLVKILLAFYRIVSLVNARLHYSHQCPLTALFFDRPIIALIVLE